MIEIKIILIAVYSISAFSEVIKYLQRQDTKPNFIWLNKFLFKYPKPLGCQFCLGKWVSLIMVLITLNPLYFIIFLLNLAVIKLRENE